MNYFHTFILFHYPFFHFSSFLLPFYFSIFLFFSISLFFLCLSVFVALPLSLKLYTSFSLTSFFFQSSSYPILDSLSISLFFSVSLLRQTVYYSSYRASAWTALEFFISSWAALIVFSSFDLACSNNGKLPIIVRRCRKDERWREKLIDWCMDKLINS